MNKMKLGKLWNVLMSLTLVSVVAVNLTSCGSDDDEPVIPVPPTPTYEAVDLGLSVKWATFNVGAVKPEDYGDYFAWGETLGYKDGKTTFTWNSYRWGTSGNLKKYNDDDFESVLKLEDDAAHVQWGGNWRMPTLSEFEELCDNCLWKWETRNGVKGYTVTSYLNKKSIFLPAAGWYYENSLTSVGAYGDYWSSTRLIIAQKAYILYMSVGGKSCGDGAHYDPVYKDRCYGLSIRPVCPK